MSKHVYERHPEEGRHPLRESRVDRCVECGLLRSRNTEPAGRYVYSTDNGVSWRFRLAPLCGEE